MEHLITFNGSFHHNSKKTQLSDCTIQHINNG